ncbi:MAG TPA: hypothetical protein QF901_09005 [Gammaproteobacteria bacterium]|jgi:hypothetical protein|nr:hypothetical protein [Gammaproteobacteria bacterium]
MNVITVMPDLIRHPVDKAAALSGTFSTEFLGEDCSCNPFAFPPSDVHGCTNAAMAGCQRAAMAVTWAAAAALMHFRHLIAWMHKCRDGRMPESGHGDRLRRNDDEIEAHFGSII